jgi:hypothetical protein
MFVIISGSPADGFRYFGPFEFPENGIDWAESTLSDETWWLVPLETPYKPH